MAEADWSRVQLAQAQVQDSKAGGRVKRDRGMDWMTVREADGDARVGRSQWLRGRHPSPRRKAEEAPGQAELRSSLERLGAPRKLLYHLILKTVLFFKNHTNA